VQHELVTGGGRSSIAKVEAMRALADDSLIVHAVTGGATPDAVEERFAASRESRDSTFIAWQLASVDGQRRYGSAPGWTATDSAALAATVADVVRSEANRRSPLY